MSGHRIEPPDHTHDPPPDGFGEVDETWDAERLTLQTDEARRSHAEAVTSEVMHAVQHAVLGDLNSGAVIALQAVSAGSTSAYVMVLGLAKMVTLPRVDDGTAPRMLPVELTLRGNADAAAAAQAVQTALTLAQSAAGDGALLGPIFAGLRHRALAGDAALLCDTVSVLLQVAAATARDRIEREVGLAQPQVHDPAVGPFGPGSLN